MTAVQTYLGPAEPDQLGVTLMHEHIFVRDPELERNGASQEWDYPSAVARAVEGLRALHDLGIRTVVDLTVPGLGRDVATIAVVAAQVPVRIVAATGWYTRGSLPLHFALRGPGRPIDGPEELLELFLRDITAGIAGTTVRAGMIKIVTDEDGITGDVARVLDAAAAASRATGVAITTHSHPASRNGLDQQRFLEARGVPLDRVVIGHSGDTDDINYLRTLMDAGSTIGMDRFGMEHVMSDARRVHTVRELIHLGYVDRMILSHDAAFYSHVTPPSWRAANAPEWHMETLSRQILPKLVEDGVTEADVRRLLVDNPRRLLEPAAAGPSVGGEWRADAT